MIKNKLYLLTCTLFAVLFFSCGTTARMKQRQGIVLHRDIIKVDNAKISKDDLSGFLRQKPINRILGIFSIKTWLYEANQPKKHDNWLKRWLRNRVGAPPVILDSLMAVGDGQQMLKFLYNKGYYNAKVKVSVQHLKRKRANLLFDIKTGDPYRIRNISYDVRDSLISTIVLPDTVNTLLTRGERLDSYVMNDERERVTHKLKNEGFYLFSKEFLRFSIDSTLNLHQGDIKLTIGGATGTEEERLSHKQFRIRNFLINPDYQNQTNSSQKIDTIVTFVRKDNLPNPTLHYYHFIQQGPLRIKPQSILNSILFKRGDLYNLDLATQSYSRLSDLPIFRYINIDFKPVPDSVSADSSLWLDCNIQLMRNPAQSYAFEFEGTNNGGRLGIGGNLVYKNLNIFRGGETFYIRLNGAAEMQQSVQQKNRNFIFFNTFETGIETGLTFPKLLLPIRNRSISRTSRPRTTFQTGVNMQQRIDYKRFVTNIAYNYEWKSSDFITHNLVPLEISSVRLLNPSAAFTTYLNGLDPRFSNQYTDHLIWALRYTFLYNTQQLNRATNFMYFRLSAESSGNTLNVINNLFNTKKNAEGYRTLLNIKYAQYLRSDMDYRYYSYISKKKIWVFRSAVGLGLPYGNSSSLPFEKAFFAGGANDMRGWVLRSLGPGGYHNTANRFDKTGDIQIESNVEYRFPIYDFVNGGLFCDAGNIWLLNKNKDFPDGEFSSNFLKQVALDAGFGLRFDFSFFVIRIDAAIPIRYPYLNNDQHWVDLRKTTLKNVVWQFALGYPFQ